MNTGAAVFAAKGFRSQEAEAFPHIDLIADQRRHRSAESLDEALRRIENLPINWDSYGAAAPHGHAVQRAREALAQLKAQLPPSLWQFAFVNPTPPGGIQLEWDIPGQIYAELEIPPQGEEFFLLFEKTGRTEQWHVQTMDEAVARLTQFLLPVSPLES